VIALDTNVLVHAHRADSPFHAAALDCVRARVEGSARWCIPWPCVHEFLAIVTHPRIWRPPTPLPTALAACRSWLVSPLLQLVGEGPGHLDHLDRIAVAGAVAGPRIHDARIAAICEQHGVTELWTADRDFSRFSGFRTRNPMVR
jgi:toxin-antitoxin system PIN domain toxin